MANEKYNKEDVLEEIQNIFNQQHMMNTKIFKKYQSICDSDSSVDYLMHKYGGLQNLCKELNITYTRANMVNHDDLISDIKRVFEECGHMSVQTYKQYGKYSVTCVKKHFNNSFNQMLKELGFEINMLKNITKQDVIDDVTEFYNTHNTTSVTKYKQYGMYSQCTIQRLFGGWHSLMDEMNLPYFREEFGYDEVLRQIKNVYARYGFLSKDLVDTECEFSYQALAYYFQNKQEISDAIGVPDCFNNVHSNNASIVYHILCNLFGQQMIETEKTWDWLINDKTGKHMYIDFFIPKYSIAIEYDGKQHSQYVKQFHQNQEGYANYIYRDKLKNKLCKQYDIPVIRIPYDAHITEPYINMQIIDCLLKRSV